MYVNIKNNKELIAFLENKTDLLIKTKNIKFKNQKISVE